MAERRGVSGPAPAQAEDFASLIRLEQTGPGCFRNLFSDLDFQGGHMFGGQLLAQGLAAAMATVEGKRAKSLHAYYLRRGNVRYFASHPNLAAITVAVLDHAEARRLQAAPAMRSYWPGSLLFASRWVASGRMRQGQSWRRRSR